jgi:hypothetical protein
MAFNPFESFRKNQRSLMAFAAIVCMIVFVFSFGQGDFFQTLQEWLATRTRTGSQVTTLYGEPVYESQLDKIARQRDLTNSFMVRTTALGVNMAMTELEKQQKDIKEGMDNPFGRVMQGWGMRRNPFFAQQMRLPPGWQAMSVQNDLSFLSAQTTVIKNEDQMRMLQTLSISLGFVAERRFSPAPYSNDDLLAIPRKRPSRRGTLSHSVAPPCSAWRLIRSRAAQTLSSIDSFRCGFVLRGGWLVFLAPVLDRPGRVQLHAGQIPDVHGRSLCSDASIWHGIPVRPRPWNAFIACGRAAFGIGMAAP